MWNAARYGALHTFMYSYNNYILKKKYKKYILFYLGEKLEDDGRSLESYNVEWYYVDKHNVKHSDPILTLQERTEVDDEDLPTRVKIAEAFQQSQGRAPTEDEIDQLLEGLSQDTSLQDDMLRAGEQAAQTPAPAENKKRKLEEGAEENANKKTSPASVTDPAATQ